MINYRLAFKLFNPFVILRNASKQFSIQNHYKNCTFSFLANARHIRTSQIAFNRNTPELIYVPQVLRWLKTKFNFRRLQKTWDPEFTEGAFIYGTTQALCTVSDIIHKNQPEELKGLLTENARIKLVGDMATKLTKLQKKIIKITPNDIKILVPTEVNLIKQDSSKTCEVSLRTLALKWFEEHGNLRLVLVALQTGFTRDYTEGVTPEWTISIYDILECAMLSEHPTVN